MKLLGRASDPRHAIVERLAQAAGDAGLTLYWVGGSVRDALLERPITDVDLSVAGGAAQPMKTLSGLARKLAVPRASQRRNERFLTLSFEVEGVRGDLAALRREDYDAPGVLPRVEAGSLEEDLLRRDFTVNALAVPISSATAAGLDVRAGGVIDLVGGLDDLEAKTLRVLHPRSFYDDPTRALRAARFGGRLGFKLARASRNLLHDAIRDGAFTSVSGERLRREFEKLFREFEHAADLVVCLDRLESWHVLGGLEPGFGFPREARAAVRRLGRLWAEPPWTARAHRPWVGGLCVWFEKLRPGVRRRVLQRLSIRGETAGKIDGFGAKARRAARTLERGRGRGAADRVLSAFDEEELFAFCASCASPLRRRVVRYACEDRDRRSLISGKDLTALGLAGPVVGTVLARVRAAMLDAEVAEREEALALAREVARRHRQR